ncbi:MAG: transcriptional repressor [Bacteroidetes bacterium]|nr:MAG: transcriptional repressor [Bacteroidota bacterium]
MQEEAFVLLGNKNLSRTPCRVEMLKVLLDSGSALSDAEIRSKLPQHFDRTTIYRTLRSFLEQDVIHSIALEGGDVRYAVTRHKDQNSRQFHAHFFCDSCSGVYCLSRASFVPPEMPDGFVASGYDVLVNGKCRNCN